MKAIIFSRKGPVQDQSQIKKLLQSLRVHGVQMESVDADSIQGSQLAEVYGVMDYPAVVVVTEDGAVRGFWQGNLPSAEEISLSVGYI
jgi:hypothetical protein